MGAINLKRAAEVFFIFFLVIYLTASVYAITGSIGNARMILRVDTGDKIEKYILVKNVNNVSLDIELTKDGELSEDIEIKDEKFSLAPGEDKKAYFTINLREPGTTESKIYVKFSPQDKGNGVGLSSTIIVIAEGEKKSFFDFFSRDNKDNEEIEKLEENQTVSVGVESQESENSDVKETPKINILLLLSFLTIILFAALLILVINLKSRRGYKKGVIIKPKKSVQIR